MISRQLLRKLLSEILEEQGVKLRVPKGYAASHPVINRKPFMLGLGKSNYAYEHEKEDLDQKKDENQKEDQKSIKKVKISKAFDKEELKEYTHILKELINAEKLC